MVQASCLHIEYRNSALAEFQSRLLIAPESQRQWFHQHYFGETEISVTSQRPWRVKYTIACCLIGCLPLDLQVRWLDKPSMLSLNQVWIESDEYRIERWE